MIISSILFTIGAVLMAAAANLNDLLVDDLWLGGGQREYDSSRISGRMCPT